MHVIGTAGHVDHGKSTLVKALTSIDPDRLPEEKSREMTIDLGFAWLTLPSGREISIVDVPGHERFIKNMLAGVGAIDLALLVVAADESVMQQTREHLAILDLLHIRRLIVVVTKSDLADEEIIELVKAEVEDLLAGTHFEGAPMLPVSAYTGAGLPELKQAIDGVLAETEARRDLGRPRLPIDRSFTVSGFGTVVTGTLIDGSFTVGQEVELAPSGRRGRIRGLQSHKSRVEHSEPGVRLAVNLAGLERADAPRGEILTLPNWLKPAARLDARLKMARNAPHALRHNAGVTFHLFTAETPARVRLLDAEELPPGGEGWAQILLENPVPMVKGDLFILRSAEDTLAGGQVADPNPARRHRRFSEETLAALNRLAEGSGEDALVSVADRFGPCNLAELARRSNLALAEAQERATRLAEAGDLAVLGQLGADALVWSRQGWDVLQSKAYAALRAYHTQYPLRRGAPNQELRSRLGLAQAAHLRVVARLAAQGLLAEDGPYLRLPDHQPTLTPQQAREAAAYLGALAKEPYAPPTDLKLAPEVLGYLAETGQVVKVNESVVFTAAACQEMTEKIVACLKEKGAITVGEARELFNTSRKYILPLLEYLDQQRVTRRQGDERTLR